jgi:ATP-dependent helicase/nuclease subunit B
VQVRFLLGPAGSGKTFQCLREIREALVASPQGPPLVLLAPKQTTYQLERQLLSDPAIPGYTRLQILSFERLARFVFERLGKTCPDMLDEEGRVMVLRALLARKRDDLKLFRASARLTGFAHQLSLALRELQQNQLTPEGLKELAAQISEDEGLSHKLQDLATMLQNYLEWLDAHRLQDADCLLAAAAREVQSPKSKVQSLESKAECGASSNANFGLRTSHFGLLLWVDGFAEFSEQELALLVALVPRCEQATLTFCLDRAPVVSWLSNWSVVRRTFEHCRKRLEGLPDVTVAVRMLERDPDRTRFTNSPMLQHLEQYWGEARAYEVQSPKSKVQSPECEVRSPKCEVGKKTRGTKDSGQLELMPMEGRAAKQIPGRGYSHGGVQ